MMEKTEEQIAKERAAVDAMRNAKANMEAGIARVSTLEFALRSLVAAHRGLKDYVGKGAYAYPSNSSNVTVHSRIDESCASAEKALGA